MNANVNNKKSQYKPLISIITPVLNGARFIEQTIQTVINQDYENIEYIIIDGGSTDQTLDIIKKYANKISFWVSEPDKGIYDAQNKGVFHSSGEYFVILNSGDFFAGNDVVSKIAERIIAFPNVDYIYSNAFLLKDTKNHTIISFKSDISNIYKHNSVPHPTLFSRTRFFKETGGFDTSLKISADYDYVFRLTANRCLGTKIKEFTVYIRQGGYSYLNLDSLEEFLFVQKKHNVPVIRRYINYYYKIFHFHSLLFLLRILGEKKFNKLKEVRYFGTYTSSSNNKDPV